MRLLQIVIRYAEARSLNFSKDKVHADRANFEFAKWHIRTPNNHYFSDLLLLLKILFKSLKEGASVEQTIEDCEHEIQV